MVRSATQAMSFRIQPAFWSWVGAEHKAFELMP